MSSGHTGKPSIPHVSRRRVLTIAAVGVGTSAAGVAGLSFAREKRGQSGADGAPLVLSLRDAKSGTFDLFAGASRIQVKDPELAEQLLKLARKR